MKHLSVKLLSRFSLFDTERPGLNIFDVLLILFNGLCQRIENQLQY